MRYFSQCCILLLLVGCVPYHKHNATAEQNWVKQPPAEIEEEGAEKPAPGTADMFYFSPGMFTSLGVSSPDSGPREFNMNLGLEWTIGYARASYTNGLFKFAKVDSPHVERAVAIKAGWTTVERIGGFNGPAYLELITGYGPNPAFLLSLGAGWIADLEQDHHGFMISGYLGPFYMRIQNLVGDRVEVLWGIQAQLPIMFVFDR